MTDLNDRLGAMLDGEPTAPYDLDRVVTAGRRSLRRRSTITAVAGTAGAAAVTAAIVVPIAGAGGSGGSSGQIHVATQPTAATHPRCKAYFEKPATKSDFKHAAEKLRKKIERRANATGTTVTIKAYGIKPGLVQLTACPPGATLTKSDTSTSTAPALPPYSYTTDPAAIASGFGAELAQQVKTDGLSVIYTRPFAQESSTLEKGHPTYFGGNVDVQLPDGAADIGVQVTHAVTELVPFDGACSSPDCTQSTLPDGSVMQVSHIKAGSGGAEIITVEVHRPDGLVVQAQEANYAFGPEATKARSSQPLPIDGLSALALDPAFTF